MGGMLEADGYFLLGVVYSGLITMGSAAIYWWLEPKPGLEWLADASVLLWVGLGMSGVSWMKVFMSKRSPAFSTACSMTTIIIFLVIMQEGDFWDFLRTCWLVLIGSLTSNLVCYCLWPQRATQTLHDTMSQTLNSFATVLQMLTDTFLLDDPLYTVGQDRLQKAVERHQASFTSLKKSLNESYSEWFFGGPSGSAKNSSGLAYEDAVDSLNRLGQHLNG